jgi:plasmid maintenance system antidote protein VapI
MEAADLSTTGMADKLHVSEQTIKNWLADAHRISRVHCKSLERIERRLATRQAVQA